MVKEPAPLSFFVFVCEASGVLRSRRFVVERLSRTLPLRLRLVDLNIDWLLNWHVVDQLAYPIYGSVVTAG